LANTVHTKTYRECKATRARICLRKLGKLPIESAAIEKMIKKAVKDKSNDYKEGLSLQDVIDAFLCGDEAFQVIQLQCVGYEHEFIHDLTVKFPKFDHTAKSNKKR